MTLYEILLLFFIYGFLGWCTEVAFAAFKQRTFVNRGFLYGPICPIYGICVACVVSLLNDLKGNIVLLYVMSVVLVTVLEWITGVLLEKLFRHKWWDYSNLPLNIGGYVCLSFSLIWGIACVFVVKLVQPFIMKAIGFIPKAIGIIFLVVVLIGFVIDICVTVQGILSLNLKLAKMKELTEELQKLSEKIGKGISDYVLDSLEKQDSMRKRMEEVKTQYQELTDKHSGFSKRMVKAFPTMKTHYCEKQLKDLKELIKKKKDGGIK